MTSLSRTGEVNSGMETGPRRKSEWVPWRTGHDLVESASSLLAEPDNGLSADELHTLTDTRP